MGSGVFVGGMTIVGIGVDVDGACVGNSRKTTSGMVAIGIVVGGSDAIRLKLFTIEEISSPDNIRNMALPPMIPANISDLFFWGPADADLFAGWFSIFLTATRGKLAS